MQSGQPLGVAVRAEGEDVGEHSPGREGQREPECACNAGPALPDEVDRQQRQDEQAGVPEVERRQFVIRAERKTEQRRHLDGQRRGHGKAQDDEHLGVSGVRRFIGSAGADDQLLPQPLGVRACELARQRIEAAHALDRDQEGFFSCQAGLGQRRQLVAQMSLELLDVGTVKGLPAAQILPPLRDLLLERLIGEGRHAVHACIQIPRSVPSTTCHCCRCAASCARPSLVIR